MHSFGFTHSQSDKYMRFFTIRNEKSTFAHRFDTKRQFFGKYEKFLYICVVFVRFQVTWTFWPQVFSV